MRHAPRVVLCLLIGWATARCWADEPAPGPLSAADERATLRLLDPELQIDLVASEPDISSPVAIAWDEDGRLYVVEMTDYPTGPRSGKIRLLEDRDGDGRYETVTTFAENLNFPNGVLPWNGGILVTAAPDILFLKDDDGDGVADQRRVVLTGFAEGNEQLRVNGLTWGADNWVYGANGRSDGAIRRPDDPESAAVPLRHHDFRFRPDTGEFQIVSGFSQFGLARDDWGRRFPSWNTIPIRHVVIEERTLNRNPRLAESSSVAEILDMIDGGRVFPISPTQTTFNRESTAYFNATCGPTIYRGDALGDAYCGNIFFCESLTNLVQRRVLEDRGPTFLARRVEPDREFLASTDPYFRPVNLATGSDGALYVVDFYRELVEHPQFVPEELRDSVDFRRWNNRGRLWRISRKDAVKRPPPRLGGMSAAELTTMFAHPNGWVRDASQRLIVERGDKTAAPALAKLASSGSSALERAHALWTLDGLGALDDATLSRSLADPVAEIREAAAKLADGRPSLADAVVSLADDPDVRVRFQASIALGDLDDPRVPSALARIAARDVDDEWIRLAVLSGLGEIAQPFLDALLDAHPQWLAVASPSQGQLLRSAASIIGARDRPEELAGLASRLAPDPNEPAGGRLELLAGLAEGLDRGGRPSREWLKAGAFPGADGVGALLDRAAGTVASAVAPTSDRTSALAVLARCRPELIAERLPDLMRADQPEALQSASARALAVIGSPEAASRVLEDWEGLSTTVRREALSALTSSVALADRLVEALEDGELSPAELGQTERAVLEATPDEQLRRRVEAFFASLAPQDRTEALRKLQPVLDLSGDPDRGAEVFAQHCQTCHQRQGVGHHVGPDLSGVASRPPSALLKDIIDPNADVTPDNVAFLVVTKAGRTFSGLLVEETASSLKLRGAEGVEQSILRSEIEAVRPTGKTLMPEGFEDAIDPQGLADLIAFLKRI